ncbi:hypothetical protein LZ30DRAFT_694543 [Colletotrichum cereale]|nr:hypothetical protein LZ30DRAFT_694543 [Colletotrichum cereale]
MKITAFLALTALASQGALAVAVPQDPAVIVPKGDLEKRDWVAKFKCYCKGTWGVRSERQTREACAYKYVKGRFYDYDPEFCFIENETKLWEFQKVSVLSLFAAL